VEKYGTARQATVENIIIVIIIIIIFTCRITKEIIQNCNIYDNTSCYITH